MGLDLGLSGRSICVAGGSRGVGLALVRMLAAEGAGVAVVSRNAPAVAVECAHLSRMHRVVVAAIQADVNDQASIERGIGEAEDRLGGLHGLAVTTHGGAQSPRFIDMDDREWQRQFEEVLLGPAHCVRAVLPRLIGKRDGAIVLTGAYSARAAGTAIAGYAAMKAAIVNLAKGLAKAHGRDGIRVNAVCPGFVATGRAETRLAAIMADTGVSRLEAERALLSDVGMAPALERLAAPKEVAAMIAFLLSSRASYVSGLIANVDGGTDF